MLLSKFAFLMIIPLLLSATYALSQGCSACGNNDCGGEFIDALGYAQELYPNVLKFMKRIHDGKYEGGFCFLQELFNICYAPSELTEKLETMLQGRRMLYKGKLNKSLISDVEILLDFKGELSYH